MTWGTPISGSLQIYQLVGLKYKNLANELSVGRRLENCLKCYFRGSQGWPKPKLTALELGKDCITARLLQESRSPVPKVLDFGSQFWSFLILFDTFPLTRSDIWDVATGKRQTLKSQYVTIIYRFPILEALHPLGVFNKHFCCLRSLYGKNPQQTCQIPNFSWPSSNHVKSSYSLRKCHGQITCWRGWWSTIRIALFCETMAILPDRYPIQLVDVKPLVDIISPDIIYNYTHT